MKNAGLIGCMALLIFAVCGPKPESTGTEKDAAASSARKTLPDPGAGIRLSDDPSLADLPLMRDPADINQTISTRQGGVNYCYKRHIDQSGKARGRVVVSFTITQDGRVKDVAIVESDFEKEDFYDCLVESVMRWRFDRISPAGEEQNVQCPFEF